MMGYPPFEIDRMTPMQYAACVDGWMRGHDPEIKDELPTMNYDEFKEFMAS